MDPCDSRTSVLRLTLKAPEAVAIGIVDVAGRNVRWRRGTRGHPPIPAAGLAPAPGMYFARVTVGRSQLALEVLNLP
jgi:hypothetical protein